MARHLLNHAVASLVAPDAYAEARHLVPAAREIPTRSCDGDVAAATRAEALFRADARRIYVGRCQTTELKAC